MNVRKTTCRALELADEGIISWKALAEAALKWMSEDDVAEMLKANEIDVEEAELDYLYHNASEDELREMGCFDNLDDEEDAQDAYDQDEETNRDSYLTSLF